MLYTTMAGGWLEADPVGGYNKIFIACMIASAIGIVCAFIVTKKIEQRRSLGFDKIDEEVSEVLNKPEE